MFVIIHSSFSRTHRKQSFRYKIKLHIRIMVMMIIIIIMIKIITKLKKITFILIKL